MSQLYVRIDDRLIHGQIVTSWVKTLDIKRIVAVDDKIANNEMMKSIVTMGVPSNIESKIIAKSQVESVLKEKDVKTLLIVRFARELAELTEELKDAVHINVGNCSKQENASFTLKGFGVGQTLSFTKEDVQALDRYDENRTSVILQQLPNDKVVYWKDVKERRS